MLVCHRSLKSAVQGVRGALDLWSVLVPSVLRRKPGMS